jgi:2-C-methyl-D-erythritol 4-phosphate cytidylyltransferase
LGLQKIMANVAIITAAGIGKRMGTGKPKQYLELAGRPILCHTLDKFQAASSVNAIIIVADMSSIDVVKNQILKKYSYSKVKWVVTGGEKRQDSVAAGLRAAPEGYELVCIHDGVRPFVTPGLIDKSFEMAKEHGACIVAIPVKDTIKRVNDVGKILETVERSGLWRAQTPQTFRYDVLESAMSQAMGEEFYATDDAALVEHIGHNVYVLPGNEQNIKITTPEDLEIAEIITKNSPPL